MALDFMQGAACSSHCHKAIWRRLARVGCKERNGMADLAASHGRPFANAATQKWRLMLPANSMLPRSVVKASFCPALRSWLLSSRIRALACLSQTGDHHPTGMSVSGLEWCPANTPTSVKTGPGRAQYAHCAPNTVSDARSKTHQELSTGCCA